MVGINGLTSSDLMGVKDICLHLYIFKAEFVKYYVYIFTDIYFQILLTAKIF